MATLTDRARRVPAINRLARGFVFVLGVGAIAWGMVLLPVFSQEASPGAVAAKLIDGDSFKLPLLVEEAHRAEKAAEYRFCNPGALHSLLVLRVFILNKSIAANNQALVDRLSAPLYDANRDTLSCVPTDSFAWLTLFWLDAGKHGLNSTNLNYLRLSYEMGPNEGWIALWRLRLAFVVFDRLPTDLADLAATDFINLVNTGQFYWQAAEIFRDNSPVIQGRIIEKLKFASMTTREAFARTLHDRGVDIDIPGVERQEARPWR